MKKTMYACLIAVLALVIPFNIALADPTGQNIHVEWSYDVVQPEGRVIEGFKLYKDGEQVCDFNDGSLRVGDCIFNSEPGEFNFTLTSYGNNGFESLVSDVYTFELTDDRNAPVLIHITGRQVNIVVD